MDIQENWEKALRKTEIIRPRVLPLQTFAQTRLPYVILSESSVNSGDTVVRKGEVLVEKPSLILPSHLPNFEGFKFDEEMHMSEDAVTNFFLVRGVLFPSLKYNNKTDSIDVREGSLSSAVSHYSMLLQKNENVSTGLVIGPEDCWQFSVLIFIGGQVVRSAEGDFRNLMDDYRKKGWMS